MEPLPAARMPLSSLLSQVLVAFTIECDNRFERRLPHRTTAFPVEAEGPWLASMAMWWTCMRFVPEDGIEVGELVRLARIRTNLKGLVRWGYLAVEAGAAGGKRVRPTAKGLQAQEVWRVLPGEVEEIWRERWGGPEIDRLRAALAALLMRIPFDLPDGLPILGYGLFCKDGAQVRRAELPAEDALASLPLPVLLARLLLAFALDFERQSEVSLAIAANVLRVLDRAGVEERRLPALSGVSREAIRMALGVLEKKGIAESGAQCGGSRFRVVRLTGKGDRARKDYARRLREVEARWQERFDGATVAALRRALEPLTGPGLFAAVAAGAGWLALVRPPETLPHFPMVLHRGGYPDGS